MTATTQQAHPAPGTLPDSPRRILIADDEHLVATGLSANLQEIGYEVVGLASDGESATALCEREKPDMALLDIRMPGMNGIDAAKTIYERNNIPVIIVSAYADDEYVELCRDAGVFGYLLKPVTKDQMRVAVPVAWERYRKANESTTEIAQLNQRLEQRKTIEKAKWALVSQGRMSEPDAMRLLQRDARNNRRPLVDVATDVIENKYLIRDN